MAAPEGEGELRCNNCWGLWEETGRASRLSGVGEELRTTLGRPRGQQRLPGQLRPILGGGATWTKGYRRTHPWVRAAAQRIGDLEARTY